MLSTRYTDPRTNAKFIIVHVKLPKDCLLWECIENLQIPPEGRKQVLMEELKQFLLGRSADLRFFVF